MSYIQRCVTDGHYISLCPTFVFVSLQCSYVCVFPQGGHLGWHWAPVLCVSCWECWCCWSSCPALPCPDLPWHTTLFTPAGPGERFSTTNTNMTWPICAIPYLFEMSSTSGFLFVYSFVIYFVYQPSSDFICVALPFQCQISALRKPKEYCVTAMEFWKGILKKTKKRMCTVHIIILCIDLHPHNDFHHTYTSVYLWKPEWKPAAHM